MKRFKPLPSTTYDAVLLVTSYCEGRLEGMLTHPRLKQAEPIRSVPQMLFVLGELLDQEDALLSYPGTEKIGMKEIEQIATIRIQVLFREHYTWQGCILWEEDQKMLPFHSVLEMIQILDEILTE